MACAAVCGCSGTIGESANAPAPNSVHGKDAAHAGAGAHAPNDTTGDDLGGPTAGAPGDVSNEPGTDPAAACDADMPDPGPSPLQRLSRVQYANTVRDLFGEVPNLDAQLGNDDADAYEFGLVQPDVAPVELETYQSAAETIAAATTADASKLDAIAPCAAGVEPRTCARDFVQDFGSRVYRAPLADDADIDRHMALYDAGAATDYAHGIELVLRGMLQSPRFLYRVEIGRADAEGPRAIELSGYELAARLAYTLWNTAPDATLTEAAANGELDTPAGVAAEVSVMLADEKGVHAVRAFLERWLQLPRLDAAVKDEALFPDWNGSGLRASMRTQAQRLLDDVLEKQGGTISALLTSPTVFVNADLGAYYGVSGGAAFSALEPDDGRASGVLTLPGFLALMAKPAESSPIYRGKFVREALLCHTLPPPPPNIPKPPDVTPGVSTRARLSQHETDAACSGCHQLMDPIGFGFEHYDAVGRYRSEDGAEPVDARGELIDTRDIDGAFSGVVELGHKLAGSDQVRECIARQWFRFALGRYERDTDACSIARLVSGLQQAGWDLNALPRALVETDAFLYRHPLDYEEPK